MTDDLLGYLEVLFTEVELKDDGLFVGSDSEPVSGSENLITSDGVYKLSEELKKTATILSNIAQNFGIYICENTK